jgi:hypothetical protein
MGNRKAAEALRITGRGGGNQGGKEPQIDGEGGRGLRGAQERETAKDGEGGTKASAESSTSVVDRAAQTQAPQGGREAGLHIGSRRERIDSAADRTRPSNSSACPRQRARGVVRMKWFTRTTPKESEEEREQFGVLKPGQASNTPTKPSRERSTNEPAAAEPPRGTPRIETWSKGTKGTPGRGQGREEEGSSQNHSHLGGFRKRPERGPSETRRSHTRERSSGGPTIPASSMYHLL